MCSSSTLQTNIVRRILFQRSKVRCIGGGQFHNEIMKFIMLLRLEASPHKILTTLGIGHVFSRLQMNLGILKRIRAPQLNNEAFTGWVPTSTTIPTAK